MNSLFSSKAIHRHTWYSPTGFSKRVDYILAEWYLKKLCSNCHVYRKASIPFEKNHRLLTLSCSFPSKRKQKQFFSPISKPIKPHKNISLLYNDPDVCNSFSNKLDDLLSVALPKNNDVNIIQASESEIPKLEASAKKSPWINDEFLSLTKARRAFVKIQMNLKNLVNLLKNYVTN